MEIIVRTDEVEIYSDATNAAVIRHPGRKFPGVLIQGDTLYSMCQRADLIARMLNPNTEEFEELNDLRNHLWSLLTYYKSVLVDHDHEIPFSEQPA